MLSFSGSLKIFVLVESCDMRKGFNGLYGMVSSNFGEDPKSGALFVFSNRRHTRIKILYFDGSGLWLLTKTNAPHCPQRFLTSSLSVSPSFRTSVRSVWCCWRSARSGVCADAKQCNTRHSGVDV